MEAFFEHWVTQSLVFSLLAITLVAFLESLALVGLLLPGTVMMATLGALIGSGKMAFYPAWGAGIIGCLLGDWISWYIGHAFKKPLKTLSFWKKHRTMLTKTEHALHRHSMMTILVGRFIGPTRPLVPLVAGMLDLSPYKFALPNIIGCLSWPPVYLLHGILAGVAINIPPGESTGEFRLLLLAAALLLWLACWLLWRWARSGSLEPLAAPRAPTLAGAAADAGGRGGHGSAGAPSADAAVRRPAVACAAVLSCPDDPGAPGRVSPPRAGGRRRAGNFPTR